MKCWETLLQLKNKKKKEKKKKQEDRNVILSRSFSSQDLVCDSTDRCSLS